MATKSRLRAIRARKVTTADKAAPFVPHVRVRFRPDAGVPYIDGAEKELRGPLAQQWAELAGRFPAAGLRRRYRPATSALYQKLLDRARKMDPAFVPPVTTTSFTLHFGAHATPSLC